LCFFFALYPYFLFQSGGFLLTGFLDVTLSKKKTRFNKMSAPKERARFFT